MNTLVKNTSLAYRILRLWLNVEITELKALLSAFTCALMMFAAYSILRPVRDTMGVTSGVASLPYLFWGTFFCMLAVQPIYGWLLSHYRRAIILPRIYVFFSVMLLAFYAWFFLQQDHTWVARVYFVWVSVFNLFITAMFWSLMAEVFSREQAGRLFGFIAGGISLGGLLGPLLASLLVKPLGTINLLLISAALLLISAALMRQVIRWYEARSDIEKNTVDVDFQLKGNAWSAFTQVAQSPYLIGIAVFVFLLTCVNTILYVEQQRAVAAAISDPDARTALFANVDFWVQVLSLTGQIFLFSHLLTRFGFKTLVGVVPIIMIGAFVVIGLVPSLSVVMGATIIRRVGEYAIIRPCRDMLFTVVSREEKYQAKSLIDTFIYRGGDALSASAYAGVVALVSTATLAAGVTGVMICVIWLGVAVWLARRFNGPLPKSTTLDRAMLHSGSKSSFTSL